MNQNQITVEGSALQSLYGTYPVAFPSEDKLQERCYRWWNLNFRHCSVMHSVPNGSNLHPVERMKMVGTGLLAGAADVELKLTEGRTVHIELKNGPRKLDPKQEVFKSRIVALGHEYYQVNSFMEFVVVVCHVLNVNPTAYL